MAIHLNCQQSPVEMISGWSQPQSRTPWLWSENGIVPTAQLSSSTGDYSRDHLSWRLLGAVGRGGGPTTNPRVPRPTASYQNHHHHHHQNYHHQQEHHFKNHYQHCQILHRIKVWRRFSLAKSFNLNLTQITSKESRIKSSCHYMYIRGKVMKSLIWI